MKRLTFILALTALMVFSFGQAYAAQEMTLSSVSNTYGSPSTDTVKATFATTFTFRLTNVGGNGGAIKGSTNGFQVWTHQNGVNTDNFSAITYDTIAGVNWASMFDGGFFFSPFSVNGAGRDTIGFGGFALFKPGIPNGFSKDVYTITTTPDTDGDTLCVDSSFYPPGGAWLWSTTAGSIQPAFGGPFCYHVYLVPNLPPEIDCASEPDIVHNHCLIATADFDATDDEGDGITYQYAAGNTAGGTLNSANGQWSWGTTIGDLGSYDLIVEACDPGGSGGCGVPCTVKVDVVNIGVGSFTDGCGDTALVGMGNTATHDVDAVSADCDPISYLICDVTPTPNGTYSISSTGLLTYNSVAPDDGDICYTFTIGITDGVDTSCACEVVVCVLKTEPFEVQIEKTHLSIQGQHEYVDVTLNKGSEVIGGWDILVAYDRSALNFQTIIAGQLHSQCGYEYITWRTWFWPSYEPHFFWGGIIRVIAIADINNGANHPDWACAAALAKPIVLFTIDFVVTDNRLFECQFAPIRFFWTDCGDNSFSSKFGDTLWVSRYVIDNAFDPVAATHIENPNVGFPTYQGVQAGCLVDPDGTGPKVPPIKFIDFLNGGVDIACAKDLDDRGDINLNGVANEIADAVLFTNYFIYGLGVFHINMAGQIAATDVNADGLSLTVGDLVYLVRIIVGDAIAYPKLAPVTANYVINNGLVSVDAEMGAALVVVEGDVTPTLLAPQMDIKYAYDADKNETRVLVYSLEGRGFSGEFLSANGDVKAVDFGSYQGSVVLAKELPADYALNQNYPNPFNPSTKISFSLPVRSDYTLTIYNVTGQVVEEMAGSAEAGAVELTWDAGNLPSGIYFYKLNTAGFSDTKKMMLLK
ncbi:MAG TPA: T9SS type A sorting domain-containing protein [Candidatus Deferrimicrobium sp.]|nr:T9SS type A sorting domain-containing protein [Candidatus Deferrimicrobium sp.]